MLLASVLIRVYPWFIFLFRITQLPIIKKSAPGFRCAFLLESKSMLAAELLKASQALIEHV